MAASNLNLGKASGGVLNIQPTDGVTNTSIILPASGAVANTDNIVGFKNYIINGNFDVWQYKDAGLPYPQTSSSYGSDDRWFNFNTVSTKQTSMVITNKTEPFIAAKYCRTVVTSVAGSANACGMQQRIEDVNTLQGKTVTLSFWAKADSNKNISVDFVQYFGTGGTPSTIIEGISATKIAITSNWVKYTITSTIPSIAGKTAGTDNNHSLWVRFWFDAGTDYNARTASLGQQSGTFDIAQVQLEEGSVATPFEQRPYGLELSLCQRYYEVGKYAQYNQTSITTIVGGAIYFKAIKRGTPTCALSDSSNVQSPSVYGLEFYKVVGSGLWSLGIYTASAEL